MTCIALTLAVAVVCLLYERDMLRKENADLKTLLHVTWQELGTWARRAGATPKASPEVSA